MQEEILSKQDHYCCVQKEGQAEAKAETEPIHGASDRDSVHSIAFKARKRLRDYVLGTLDYPLGWPDGEYGSMLGDSR